MQRLQDQAATLVDLLHADTFYPAGSRVLEAGCGVGAQTVTLAARSPDALITAVGPVSPRMVYVDARRPELVEGFTRKTFIAMIAGVRQPALDAGLISARAFNRVLADLNRTLGADGVSVGPTRRSG